VLNEVLRWAMQPRTFTHNTGAKSGYYNIFGVDGNIRGYKLVIVLWLPDCPESCDLYHVELHICIWCECPKNVLGEYVRPDKQYPWGDHSLYPKLSDANTRAANAKLSLRHVHQGFNTFHQIPCIVSNLPKPNLLHTIQISTHDSLQKCTFPFTKIHEQLKKHDVVSFSNSAYYNLTPKDQSVKEVSQWNGKEIKELSQYLIAVVTQSLLG
jgi:hypothetical protein